MSRTHADTYQVVFVDPDRYWLGFAERTLAECGLGVYCAVDIQRAECMISSLSGWQLVLVDLGFAEQEPDALARFARHEHVFVAVLFAVKLRPHQMSRVFRLGVFDCVGKPYSRSDLLALVEGLFEEIDSKVQGTLLCWAANGVSLV